MVSLKVLAKKGITVESLRKKLESSYSGSAMAGLRPDDAKTQSEKLALLRNRIRSRIQNGQDQNLSKYKIFYALDQALDVSFKQVEPTLIRAIMGKDEKTIEKCASDWSLQMERLWVDTVDPKTNRSTRKLSIPAFFEIFVPLSRAYLTIRWAKIMDGYYRTPLLPYAPALNDEKTRLKCKVVESRAERMSEEYGYFQVIRQCVLQMLHYGTCLQFPCEEWHKEEQEDINGKAYVVREGIRYHMPHPSRMYVDDNHRLSTLNSDTGCEYVGYWRIVRYKDIRENKNFYNRDKVTMGPTGADWWNNASNFFATVYSGCTMKFPSAVVGQQDREGKIADGTYSQAWDDNGVQITEHFEKIVPSDYGLGDYDYPVWFRFVIAGYDTIVYAAPLPYSPGIYWGYDPDENRDMNTSLTLETMAFQDHFSNLVQQQLLTVKQNLDNITFVNTDIVGEEWIAKVESSKSMLHKTRNFFAFSARKLFKSQQDKGEAMYTHRFAPLSTQEILAAMRMLLDTLERVLVMSSQEVGAAASHEQSATEQRMIASQTSTRLAFTTMGCDQAIEAMKRQLYDGLMEYGQDEFYAELPLSTRVTPELLHDMGFTWDEKSNYSIDGKIIVKGKKTAIDIDSFVSLREKRTRADSMETALAMSNALATWLSSPVGPAIGPDQAIKIINVIAELAGFPREFKLENRSPQNGPDQVQEMAKEIHDKIMQEIEAGMKPLIENEKVQEQRLGTVEKAVKLELQAMQKMRELLQAVTPPELTGAAPGPPGMPAMPDEMAGMPPAGIMPPPPGMPGMPPV